MAVQKLADRVTLDEIASNPERVLDLSRQQAVAMSARAAAAQAAIVNRLAVETVPLSSTEAAENQPDDILSIGEIEQLIHRPRSWIMRNKKRLPFLHKISRKNYVGSERALRRWINSQRV